METTKKISSVKEKKVKKKKKLTLIELKKKLSVGTRLELVEFQKEPVNLSRVVEGIKTTYVLLNGDGINPFKLYCLKYPKASELTETEDGFIIDNKFSISRYKWIIGEINN